MRQRSHRPVVASVVLEDIDPVDPRVDLRPEHALEMREVFVVIASLPPDFRDVLVAVDVAGLSYKEAAWALGIRKGTVMSRLYRARERVERALRSGGIEADEATS